MSVRLKLVENLGEPDLHAENTALRQRIALLEEVINNFPGGILLTDKDLNVLICNDYQRSLQDYPEALFENNNLTLSDLFRFNAERGEYGDCNTEEIIAEKMALAAKHEAHHYERTRPNGNVVEVRGVPLKAGGFVTSYMDVTENRRHQALVADLALTDPLTGLANRRLLMDRFEQACARAKRGESFAVHYLDLDHFKPINDKHGHKAGDAVLLEVAKRLKSATRETDTVARIGGDEFVVLQSSANAGKSARLLAGRLASAISLPILFEDQVLNVTSSIGVTVSSDGNSTLDDLMKLADHALYQSKRNGRNGVTLNQPASEQLRMKRV
ncbi:diguanylate cyclase domain-containing protein [Aestuariivirga litoralis]|uniref:diguanylate cyclase domain-containing protein n=1 Tax=Aestuariivirga litoralis TaxID=2650924 RepID=UPI0018C8265E|nr:diguanylate cyclase [Aestuariivirga litoralis]MBG1233210.1 diguanylate cyclase [Aestuariivirga litoralis]